MIRYFSAFAVHILTASGAGLALLALVYATVPAWSAMFICLGAALMVDGIDGPLARRLGVEQRLPRWSGEVLDLVVDFASYVFVPAFAIVHSGLLPDSLSVACGVVIVVTGALYFADRNMKTDALYFKGFPAVWNVAAFYLFVLKPAPWIAAGAVGVLAILTFCPVYFVHPLRVARWRMLTMLLLVVWAILAIMALAANLEPVWWVSMGLVLIAVYFLAAGLAGRTS